MSRCWAILGLLPYAAFGQSPRFVPVPAAPYSIAQTETTVEEFAAFAKATGYRTDAERSAAPRTWKTPGFQVHRHQPVVYVTAPNAAAYCEHIGARLPTDAEWEYAARAGAKTRHYWGDPIDPRYLWYRANAAGHPHPVATKLPNAWGLYDMEGNVWEWTVSPPVNGDALANRRGGSWIDCEDIDGGPGGRSSPLIGLATYFKVPIKLNHRYDDIGFRCVRDLGVSAPAR